MNIIPAIDLRGGKVVRLLRGEFSQQTDYSDDPAAIAEAYSALPVMDLHVVDLDGAESGRGANTDAIQRIARQSRLALQVGGGIRSRDDVARWLEHGIARCVIGSVAAEDPEQTLQWIDEFGAERFVLALDVRLQNGEPLVATRGWTADSGRSLWECIDAFPASQRPAVLCTEIDRDGALGGPNVALYRDVLERYPELPLQASGGIRHAGDLQALASAGLPAAITGRALLEGRISAEEMATFQPGA